MRLLKRNVTDEPRCCTHESSRACAKCFFLFAHSHQLLIIIDPVPLDSASVT